MFNQIASLMDMQAKQPFSFRYGEVTSDEYLADLTKTVETRNLNEFSSQHTFLWIDKKTGLEIRCIAVEYLDFPVVEWTVYFRNTGIMETNILKDIQGIDAVFYKSADGEFVLHGNRGDWCVAESYEPYMQVLGPQSEKHCATEWGKSSNGPEGWPYYNLQMPGGGIILAVGWPGQWASSFKRDDSNGLRVKAGQELTNLYLKPGEEIRTPLIALLFWKGEDVVSAQNLWRRWFWKHNTPRVNGLPPSPLTQVQLVRHFSDGENVMWEEAQKFLAAGIKPDIYWRDANWYPSANGPFKGNDSWLNTGTWEVDPERYPNGFRAFSDWAREQGAKFLLWFEPERVGDPGSFLGKNHPEWLLSNADGIGHILDIGNPEALNWLIEHVDGLIKSEGIDWYREDMNGTGPLKPWRMNDLQDRQGITENFYIQGHLRFWDEIVRRNPGLRIDTCASGGRRNDLETMRRALPLLRSDYQIPEDISPEAKQKDVFEANQGHTYGISSWFPYYGSGVYGADAYNVRSFCMPAFGMVPPKDWEKDEVLRTAVKRAYDECMKIAPFMLEDYYPLTPYSLEHDKWIAWQFNRPEEGDGMVQAFRRSNCQDGLMYFKLRGLDLNVVYEVINLDEEGTVRMSGIDLAEKGLPVLLDQPRRSAIILYKKTA